MPRALQFAARTDTGRRRRSNQDAALVAAVRGLFGVADGMGGHPAGDVASRLALRTAFDTASGAATDATWSGAEGVPMSPGADRGAHAGRTAAPGGAPDAGTLAEAVRRADHAVRADGEAHPERRGMGTTLSLLSLDAGAGRWAVGHVGDSRIYRIADGVAERITTDHTWVGAQVRAGLMDPEQARTDPRSSILTQALGQEVPVDPEGLEGSLAPDDLWLLCSDGLVAMVPDGEVERLVVEHREAGLDTTVDALVDAANRAGGVDNVTVLLVRVAEAAERDLDRAAPATVILPGR